MLRLFTATHDQGELCRGIRRKHVKWQLTVTSHGACRGHRPGLGMSDRIHSIDKGRREATGVYRGKLLLVPTPLEKAAVGQEAM